MPIAFKISIYYNPYAESEDKILGTPNDCKNIDSLYLTEMIINGDVDNKSDKIALIDAMFFIAIT